MFWCALAATGSHAVARCSPPKSVGAAVQLARADAEKSRNPSVRRLRSGDDQLAGFGAGARAPVAPATQLRYPAPSPTAGGHAENQGMKAAAAKPRGAPAAPQRSGGRSHRGVDLHPAFEPRGADWFGHAITVGPAALFSDLALSGRSTCRRRNHSTTADSCPILPAAGTWRSYRWAHRLPVVRVMQGAMTQATSPRGLWRARKVDCIRAMRMISVFPQHPALRRRQRTRSRSRPFRQRPQRRRCLWLRPMDGVAAPDRGLWQRVRSL
jgi:hypothetical protein